MARKYITTNETDYNILINILNGIAYSIALNLMNPYLAKFSERLGATDYHIALLNSLPALVSVFAFLPGAIYIESRTNKIKATAQILFLQKLFFLMMLCVPFINIISKPLLFVLLVGFMNFPGSISIMGFQSLIGDILPSNKRSRAMGLRNRAIDISRLIVTLIAGQVLSLVPKSNSETIMWYQIFFGIAFIFGMLEVISMLYFKSNSSNKNNSNTKYLNMFITTLKDIPNQKKFISFFICSLIFHFGWQMGWPLFNIYTIKILKADEGWLSTLNVANGLFAIFAATIWAKYADKWGNSISLAFATFGMAITPILYALSSSLIYLVFFNMIIGVSIAGTILILFNILLEVTPTKNRTIYIAIYNIFINISATIAPIFSVWVKDIVGIFWALIIVGILRLLGSFAFFLRNKIIT
jgi:MFS family permease